MCVVTLGGLSRERSLSLVHVKRAFSDTATPATSSSPAGTARHTQVQPFGWVNPAPNASVAGGNSGSGHRRHEPIAQQTRKVRTRVQFPLTPCEPITRHPNDPPGIGGTDPSARYENLDVWRSFEVARLEGIEPPTHGLEDGGPSLFRRGLSGSSLRSSLRNGPWRTGRRRLRPPASDMPSHPRYGMSGSCPGRTGSPLNASAFTGRTDRTRVSALRVVSWSAATRTYGAVATGGCHGALECGRALPHTGGLAPPMDQRQGWGRGRGGDQDGLGDPVPRLARLAMPRSMPPKTNRWTG